MINFKVHLVWLYFDENCLCVCAIFLCIRRLSMCVSMKRRHRRSGSRSRCPPDFRLPPWCITLESLSKSISLPLLQKCECSPNTLVLIFFFSTSPALKLPQGNLLKQIGHTYHSRLLGRTKRLDIPLYVFWNCIWEKAVYASVSVWCMWFILRRRVYYAFSESFELESQKVLTLGFVKL